MDEFDAVGASGVPSREPFGPRLLRSLDQERGRKNASVGPISRRHHRALEEVRHELSRRWKLRKRGHSRRLVSNSTLLETAIGLLYAHVFIRRVPQPTSALQGFGRALRKTPG